MVNHGFTKDFGVVHIEKMNDDVIISIMELS